MCRYGLGLILQAKIKLLAPPAQEELVERPPRRRSLMRQISTLISRRSRHSRRRGSTSYRRGGNLDEISEEPLSPTNSPKSHVPLHRQLSRHITRLFSQSDDLPKPGTKPRYNTATFHQFMSKTFPGSIKLEEHQVAKRNKAF